MVLLVALFLSLLSPPASRHLSFSTFLAAEVDDSQESSIMTDADDTQLHTAESDDVL